MIFRMGDQGSIAARIVEARNRAGYNRSELQRRLGVAYSTLDNWERGKSEPTIPNAEILARALGCSAQWLMTGKGSPEDLGEHKDVYAEWLNTPEGKAANPREREFVASLRSNFEPTVSILSQFLAVERMRNPGKYRD